MIVLHTVLAIVGKEISCTGVMKNTPCVWILKFITAKDQWPLMHPQSPVWSQHTHFIVLGAFWNSPLSWASLVVLRGLEIPNQFRAFTTLVHFDLETEDKITQCQIQWTMWARTRQCFWSPPLCWRALCSSIAELFTTPWKDTCPLGKGTSRTASGRAKNKETRVK